jgi:thioredoxin-dependent peroxiredoxin
MASSRTASVEIGDPAPDFELPSQSGAQVRLSDFRGERVVVLYFYPKDNTRGCTAEACSFRDNYEVFTDAGAEVIGVSADSVTSHETFSRQYRLPFLLVTDSDGELRRRYGVQNRMGVLPRRVTFVIDRDGIVRHVFSSMTDIDGHVSDALRVVQDLQSGHATD